MTVGWLPREASGLFGPGAEASEAYGVLTVDVPGGDAWPAALRTARDELGCTFLDWLSAVDEADVFRVCAHVVALPGPDVPAPRRLLLRTAVPRAEASLPTATEVYAGAAWHERETHEMFGVDFPGHPGLTPLLLPESFEGHPLRKDFVLAARVAKAWPGAKEPGESEHGGPRRRQALPPGVPDPNEWGPLKGTLPAAPARRGRADAPERPVRRARSADEGSASRRPGAPEGAEGRPARRSRSAGEGSASQRAAGGEDVENAPGPARRERSADDGSASQRAAGPVRRSRSAGDGSASQRAAGAEGAAGQERRPAGGVRRAGAGDAPWLQPQDGAEEPAETQAPDEPDALGGERGEEDR
ncbi:NADH-quinone oxidoreductase subunit C [Streptomyces sp. NPDC049881]|uniref:NADH-quinone oxidoreductase subunit C n=1 Tax=Streptomyces sp. NPDC049881 TaxID=3155778 RepID=UPI00341E3E29